MTLILSSGLMYRLPEVPNVDAEPSVIISAQILHNTEQNYETGVA